ncbi:hypothetical protein C8J57DRAFT_1493239 [Mycena rebaudengoi]|nr:hypothetical protein C8J57DRAFT_1493239 [Mycena rebaudengoi]
MKFTLASLQIFIFAAILQLAAGSPASIARGDTIIGDAGVGPHMHQEGSVDDVRWASAPAKPA